MGPWGPLGGLGMRKTLILLVLTALLLGSNSLRAGDIRHSFGGDPTNSFYTDDHGGSVNNGGNDYSYYLNLRDIDQSALGTLLLYSDDGSQTGVEDGLIDEDFVSGSGIFLRPLSILDASLDGEIGLGSNSLLLPVSFEGNDSGLIVEQVSYTSNNPGDEFVIVEYRVLNAGTGNVTVQLALSNDFDVDLKSADARVGFDNAFAPLVFQQEAPPIDPSYTTVGVSLIEGQLARYRLEACSGAFGNCAIFANDGDLVREAFFQNAAGQVGDLTQGVPDQDFAVTISANLGTLAPGEGSTAVFCYNLGNGTSPSDGLSACQNSAQDCRDFYENELQVCNNGLINFAEQCDDGNNNNNDDCPDGSGGTCQNPFCGDGFLWNQGQGSEACDDGDSSVSDACPSGPAGTSELASCGDGYLWNTEGGTETCDDANSVTTDACPSGPTGSCEPARCGDGFLRSGVEDCDDGNNDVTDTCPSGPAGTCEAAFCGDGFILQGVEGCDDGNAGTSDSCPSGPSGSCQLATCGDGYVHQGAEVCDTALSGGNCTANCTSFDSCGNGSTEAGEACDDGNNNTSDTCPSGPAGTCQSARCGDGFLQVGAEDCDDGNNQGGDTCPADCQTVGSAPPSDPGPGGPPFCGNGIVEAGEMCDGEDKCNEFCRYTLTLQGGGVSENTNPVTGTGGCAIQTGALDPRTALTWSWLLGLLLLTGILRKRFE